MSASESTLATWARRPASKSPAKTRRSLALPTTTGVEISFDYIGTTELQGNTSGTLTVAGGLTLSRGATVASSNVTLAVNDVIRGSATLRVAAS